MRKKQDKPVSLRDVDTPLRMIGMVILLATIVLSPCLVAYLTDEAIWLLAWPLSIWAALFVIQMTEPDETGGKNGHARVRGEFAGLGDETPFREFASPE